MEWYDFTVWGYRTRSLECTTFFSFLLNPHLPVFPSMCGLLIASAPPYFPFDFLFTIFHYSSVIDFGMLCCSPDTLFLATVPLSSSHKMHPNTCTVCTTAYSKLVLMQDCTRKYSFIIFVSVIHLILALYNPLFSHFPSFPSCSAPFRINLS